MIEIVHTGSTREDRPKIKSGKKPFGVSGSPKSFETELVTAVGNEVQGDLDQLLSDLTEQERRFLDFQSEYELAKYRALIGRILKLALEENVHTKTLRARSDRIPFVIVESVNSKLNEITNAIIKNNQAFNLLQAIDEIHGLIVDLIS
jgi:uncharacterized protein YaaR (DUF327 family)